MKANSAISGSSPVLPKVSRARIPEVDSVAIACISASNPGTPNSVSRNHRPSVSPA